MTTPTSLENLADLLKIQDIGIGTLHTVGATPNMVEPSDANVPADGPVAWTHEDTEELLASREPESDDAEPEPLHIDDVIEHVTQAVVALPSGVEPVAEDGALALAAELGISIAEFNAAFKELTSPVRVPEGAAAILASAGRPFADGHEPRPNGYDADTEEALARARIMPVDPMRSVSEAVLDGFAEAAFGLMVSSFRERAAATNTAFLSVCRAAVADTDWARHVPDEGAVLSKAEINRLALAAITAFKGKSARVKEANAAFSALAEARDRAETASSALTTRVNEMARELNATRQAVTALAAAKETEKMLRAKVAALEEENRTLYRAKERYAGKVIESMGSHSVVLYNPTLGFLKVETSEAGNHKVGFTATAKNAVWFKSPEAAVQAIDTQLKAPLLSWMDKQVNAAVVSIEQGAAFKDVVEGFDKPFALATVRVEGVTTADDGISLKWPETSHDRLMALAPKPTPAKKKSAVKAKLAAKGKGKAKAKPAPKGKVKGKVKAKKSAVKPKAAPKAKPKPKAAPKVKPKAKGGGMSVKAKRK